MSSKFLPLQDANGDGLNDVCKDEFVVVEENVCVNCKPNPIAIVPDWTKRTNFAPFLNEKVCKYQITYTTPLNQIAGMPTEEEIDAAFADLSEADAEALRDLVLSLYDVDEVLEGNFKLYEQNAIKILLQVYGKDITGAAISVVQDAIEYVEYDLAPEVGSRLKLLYSVPFEVLEILPDAVAESNNGETSPIEVTYNASDLGVFLIRIRKALNLYDRYLRVYRATENKNLYFREDNRVFNLKDYGDNGAGSSTMRDIGVQLSDFMSDNGYNISSIGRLGVFSGNDTVTQITFGFNEDYKIQKIVFYTEGCVNKPVVFIDKLNELRQKDAWKDPTAVAYFAQLAEMDQELQAREATLWSDFIINYTYPEVYTSTPISYEESGVGCIAEALTEEAKQLGQDILDEVFSLGDAIAYKFHESVCKATLLDKKDERMKLGIESAAETSSLSEKDVLLSEVDRELLEKLGGFEQGLGDINLFGRTLSQDTIADITSQVSGQSDLELINSEARGNVRALALEQAFKTLEDSDQVFLSLCARFFNSRASKGAYDGNNRLGSLSACVTGGDSKKGNSSKSAADDLFKFGLDELKLCGLFNITTEMIECLFGGLTLEEALGKMIESALQAMSINNFGDLFIGLPPDKQQELAEMVKKKLSEGDVFQDDSNAQALSDGAAGEIPDDILYPWLKYQISSAAADLDGGGAGEPESSARSYIRASSEYFGDSFQSYDEQGGFTTTASEAVESGVETRTLAQSLDNPGSGIDTSTVMGAYVQALLEVYADNLLELADELGRFPGAPLISNIIALLDCPRPPLFVPGVMDFLQDIDLPFCRTIDNIELPRLVNPFGWLPRLRDIARILAQIIKCQVQLAIVKIIAKIFVKICELIGNAVCKALELTGDIVSSLPDLVTGRDNISNIIRESICGEDASQQQIDETIAQLVAQLGVGAQALADQETAVNFMGDISSAVSMQELSNAMLGTPSETFLGIVDTLVEYEYPEYRDAIPNARSVGSLFSNIGNLLPASFRNTMRENVSALGDEVMPATPSICLDPAKLEEYKNLRCQILEGRATPEQCQEMFCNMRDRMANDLGDLAAITPRGFEDYIATQMPPMVSDPGCNNGILPYEFPEEVESVASTLSGEMEQLKVDYSTDMLGNGPNEKNYGLFNMMMADTLGNPLSAHIRKVEQSITGRYVDFYTDFDPNPAILIGATLVNPILAAGLIAGSVTNQRGAFPTHVGRYLQLEMDTISDDVNIDINNEFQGDITTVISLEDMGFSQGKDGLFGNDLNVTEIPDVGYNVEITPQLDEDGEKIESVKFVEKARKKNPDLSVTFEDNAKGLKSFGDSDYSYGYRIEAFFADLVKERVETIRESEEIASGADVPEEPYGDDTDVARNLFSDNVRIKVIEKVNYNAASNVNNNTQSKLGTSITGLSGLAGVDEPDSDSSFLDDVGLSRSKREAKDLDVIEEPKYEFIAIDDTLENVITDEYSTGDEYFASKYPEFYQAFQQKTQYSPTTILLREILKGNTNNEGLSFNFTEILNIQNNILNIATNKVFSTIADTSADLSESSWVYGAAYDNLLQEDLEYGINNNGTWVPYSETGYTNKHMRLGISYNQYKNEIAGTPDQTRVFFLDPAQFGGNYVRPPFYIKPERQVGWLGILDALFPEFSPCKPQTTDLVDFGQISAEVDEIYPSIPVDDRLLSDPDCIIELPYNRIMERDARAGMVGLIKAAIRIYVSAHFIKALPTFTKFSPKFPQVFSSAYASFIVEDMEKSFLDTPWAFGEVLHAFKDHEFWYGFLEQSVQTYGYLVDAGKIVNVPKNVEDALIRLNDYQQAYEYPDEEDYKAAVATGEAQASLFTSIGLRRYRDEKNLAAIRETEEDAKIVMKEMVITELNYMSKVFTQNLKALNLAPDVKDTSYYIMEELTQNTSLTLNSAINPDGSFNIESDLPTIPWEENDEVEDPYYTYGGEFVIEEDKGSTEYGYGDEYIGYYHVHIDETSGQPVYMTGEDHVDEPHDVLSPMVNIQRVPIGDVGSLDAAPEFDEEKPFLMEKYIKINGEIYSFDDGMAILAGQDQNLLVSDIYPGTLSIVEDVEGNPVGLEGELGVRYGLRFSIVPEPTGLDGGPATPGLAADRYEVTSVEIDALDTALRDVKRVEANSKLLVCLINHLKEDEKFRLVARYILPMSKILSIAAMYNDLGMLPSIGEITVPEGAAFSILGVANDIEAKPGYQALPITKEVTNADGETVEVLERVTIAPISQINDGLSTSGVDETLLAELGAWAHFEDRSGFGKSPFFLDWDQWDQQLLRNSTSRIKRLFRSYYYSRDFDDPQEGDSPGEAAINRLREALKFAPGKQLVPWWMKRLLRTNPFNSNGGICKNDDLE